MLRAEHNAPVAEVGSNADEAFNKLIDSDRGIAWFEGTARDHTKKARASTLADVSFAYPNLDLSFIPASPR